MMAPPGTIPHRLGTTIDRDHRIPLTGGLTAVQAGQKSLKIP